MLCRRLDQLPLAIELAAARTPLLMPAQLLERLGRRLDLFKGHRDSDPRQHTLRATIDWSYALLDPEEQRVYRALSVFADGCTLDAAEHVTGADVETLQSLVDKSLVRRRTDGEREPRYWMLETIADYAGERLHDAGASESTRAAHATYFLELAARETDRLLGADRASTLAEFEAERENFRLAQAWWSAADQVENELRLIDALGTFWDARGPLGELRRWQEHALSRGGRHPSVDFDFLVNAAHTATRVRDYERSEELALRALALSQRNGPDTAARALMMLAVIAGGRSDHAKARMLADQALDAARASGKQRRLAITLVSAADVSLTEGDFVRAAELAGEALGHSDGLDPANRAIGLINLAMAKFRQLDVDDAVPPLREALGLAVDLGELDIVAPCLELISGMENDHAIAAQLLGAATTLRKTVEAEPTATERAVLETAEANLRETLGEAVYEAARAEGIALSTGEAVELARRSLSYPR
jgi:tetratricopeptide (TPR) repeat protein